MIALKVVLGIAIVGAGIGFAWCRMMAWLVVAESRPVSFDRGPR